MHSIASRYKYRSIYLKATLSYSSGSAAAEIFASKSSITLLVVVPSVVSGQLRATSIISGITFSE